MDIVNIFDKIIKLEHWKNIVNKLEYKKYTRYK
jgi:hypothetical protein